MVRCGPHDPIPPPGERASQKGPPSLLLAPKKSPPSAPPPEPPPGPHRLPPRHRPSRRRPPRRHRDRLRDTPLLKPLALRRHRPHPRPGSGNTLRNETRVRVLRQCVLDPRTRQEAWDQIGML